MEAKDRNENQVLPPAADASKASKPLTHEMQTIGDRVIRRLTPEQEQHRLAQERAREEYAHEQEVRRRRESANLPLRLASKLQDALLTSDDHPWKQRLTMLESRIGQGFLYAIAGGYGIGKSQLGAVLAFRATEKVSAMLIYAADLFDSIKDVYRSDEGTVAAQLAKFIKPRLLVIDEVNASLTEADIRYLHRVVCLRYDNMTDTLLITNETKANFQALVGDRVCSRMVECGGIISADWPSFRKAS